MVPTHRGLRALCQCLPVLLWSESGCGGSRVTSVVRSYSTGSWTRRSEVPIDRFGITVTPGLPVVRRPCRVPWRILRHSTHGDDVDAHAKRIQGDARCPLPLALADQAFTQWARTGKSRQRLRPLVDLALSSLPVGTSNNSISSTGTTSTNAAKATIADIGTDHGLLAVALAVTGQFRVVGVDLSEAALRNGAFALLEDIARYQQQQQQQQQSKPDERLASHPLPLEFRHGNALHELETGEADTVCIAGMGVHTMMEIVSAATAVDMSTITSSSASSSSSMAPSTAASFSPPPVCREQRMLLLDQLKCRCLILQPTHSRPRLMTYLYDNLMAIGWTVRDERIEYLSSRWYFSVAFERTTTTASVTILPGTLLMQSTDTQTQHDLHRWISHHANWIRKDAAQTGTWHDEDLLWMKHFRAFIEL